MQEITVNESMLRRWAVGLLLLFLVFVGGRLSAKRFWGTHEESRRVQIASEFLEPGHDPLIPTLRGRPIYTKPPVYYWLVAGCLRFLGHTEGAARLPSAVMAIVGMLLIYHIGRRWRGTRTGVLAAAILGTTVLYQEQSRTAELDMMFSVAILASLVFLLEAVRDPERQRRHYSWFWVLAGAAFMIKGPYALLFPVAALILLAVRDRSLRRFDGPFWVPGILLFLLVCMPYFLYVGYRVPEAVNTWGGETVGRFGTYAAHSEGLFYYFPYLAMLGLWLPFVATGIWRCWRDTRSDSRLIAAYVVAAFVILTCVPSKKTQYLLPLFPVFALAAAGWLDEWLAKSRTEQPKWPTWYLRVCMTVTTLGISGLAGYRVSGNAGPAETAVLLAAAAAGLGLTLVAWRRSQAHWIMVQAATLLLAAIVWYQWLEPSQNDLNSASKFARAIGVSTPIDETITAFLLEDESLNFYARRPVTISFFLDKKPPAGRVIVLRKYQDFLLKVGKYRYLTSNAALLGRDDLPDKLDYLLYEAVPATANSGAADD